MLWYINKTKKGKDLYTENVKILLKEIKEDKSKCKKKTLCSGIKNLYCWKYILQKMILWFKENSVKTPIKYFIEIVKKNTKFYIKPYEFRKQSWGRKTKKESLHFQIHMY